MMPDGIDDSKTNGKLKAIDGGKSTKNVRNSDEDIPPIKSLGVKENLLIRHFLTGELQPRMPDITPNIPMPIVVHKPSFGSDKRILEIDKSTNLVRELDRLDLEQILNKYISMHFSNPGLKTDYALSMAQIEKLAKKFCLEARHIDEWPRPIGFKSDDGYFFERHDFDPIRGSAMSDFPFIAKFLNRTENHTALCQVIGSILAGKPIRKLSPLLWGEPGSGKSTFLEIIKLLFGKESWADVPDGFGRGRDMFAATFVKNTVAWCIDEVESHVINSIEFRKITGSDTYPMREMRRNYVNVKLQGVFFLTANPETIGEIRNEKAIVEERLVSHKMKLMDANEKIPERKEVYRIARKDFPAFCGYCLDVFQQYGHKVVTKTNKLVSQVIVNQENDIEAVFDRYFQLDVSHSGKYTSIYKGEWQFIWERICEQNREFARTTKRSDFNAYVAKRLGRKYPMKTVKIAGKSIKGVEGLKIKKQIQSDLPRI